MKKFWTLIFGLSLGFTSYAQSLNLVRGKVLDADTGNPLENVKALVRGTDITQNTSLDGVFVLNNLPDGEQVIELKKTGYEVQILVVTMNNNEVDLGDILLFTDIGLEIDNSIITLSDDELSDEGVGGADNVAGILQSSKDAYQRAAAYNFPWFRIRGYDSANATVLMNGIEMNKLYNGRPQWSNWGGLNDVLRNQEFTNGLAPSDKDFGGILGTTYFNTRASNYRKGGRVSYASSNRSYIGRVMATYATGLLDNDWAITFSGSRRFADEGYRDGSSYNAWGGFISVEKKLNDKHSLNLTAFYTPNRRGKSSANTQEVYDLKGGKYNSYWGKQVGENRNSRLKEIKEPVAILSHYWNPNENTSLQTNIAYQIGSIGNSRLGYYRALNPDPTYYQKLPSYALADTNGSDYAGAYLAGQNFENNGQIDWKTLYEANAITGNSVYYLYEDRNDDTQFTLNSNLSSELTNNIVLNGKLTYSKFTSDNFANMIDLLGGTHFVDLNQYADSSNPDAEQNDLNNPNRQIKVGDKFNYNYTIESTNMEAFAQLQFTYDKIDFFVAGNYAKADRQRDGGYKNGEYPTNSYGKGEAQTFSDISFKGGLTYKLTGRHLINLNAGYLSNAPSLRNTFANVRITNFIVPDITSEKIISYDATYIYRSPIIQARLTGYYTNFEDVTETAFFFIQGVGATLADDEDFVNEIVTGVDKRNMGIEFALEAQVTPTVKLIGVAALGDYSYSNNPNLFLTNKSGINSLGTTYLKNTKVGGTPERAFSLGFEYRDPHYWWFGVNANYMSHNYLDISPVLRTNNFFLDVDNVPFINPETSNTVTQEEVDALLTQEEFDPAFLLNAVGGKSWKIKDYYIGFFASINNILGETFKTGGFEQSRNANFVRLQRQKNLDVPTFGPKYWYGDKTTYYLNLYVRF